LIDAHASMSVPSTVEWSSLMSRADRACRTISPRNFFATSCASSRSRFFENVE
jgi:hypothetical protein